jgi:ribonuclease D
VTGVTDAPDSPAAAGRAGAAAVPLREPRDGVPEPIVDRRTLQHACSRVRSGSGPVAVDAERASGYRYGQRAYLVQVRRAGAGTLLIDPAALPDLSRLDEAIGSAEWILHAASQDLPCLAELGMRPERLFDTELAGRLLGLPRVGLAAMVEELLGLSLDKEHSAVDWSTRPLPRSWLAYAALDVEMLVELRDVLGKRLEEDGKLAWAQEEFAAVLSAPPPPPRVDPWRRTSGVHRMRQRRQLAAVRELWHARDLMGRDRDTSPGRLLPDSAIVEAALRLPADEEALLALPAFRGRAARREARAWVAALRRAHRLDDRELPDPAPPQEGPPPARAWAERDPVAAARLSRARAAVALLAEQLAMPAENLLPPDALRRVLWSPPASGDEASVAAALRGFGARQWQVDITAAAVTAALVDDAG